MCIHAFHAGILVQDKLNRPFAHIPQCIGFGGQYRGNCDVTEQVMNIYIENT